MVYHFAASSHTRVRHISAAGSAKILGLEVINPHLENNLWSIFRVEILPSGEIDKLDFISAVVILKP